MNAIAAFQRIRAMPQLRSGGSGVFRLFAMIAHFSLSLYVARFLGFRAMSSYGFVAAGSAGMVALSGLGLDYRVVRTIMAQDGWGAIAHARDRIVLRVLVSILIISIGICIIIGLNLNFVSISPFTIIIFLGEPVIYDIHQALVARRRPITANIILFVRAASWVPAVELAGILDPSFRDIDWLFLGWALGVICAIVFACLFCVRISLLRYLTAMPIDWQWIGSNAFTARVIYVSELGIFAQTYNDRFIVAAIVSKEAAGFYIFLWTISNSMAPIIQATVFNKAAPLLIIQWGEKTLTSWRRTMDDAGRSIIVWGTIWTILVTALDIGLNIYGRSFGSVGVCLIISMSIATAIRLRSELIHQALYSAGRDSDWIAVNIIGLIIAPPMTAIAVALFGVIGAGLQMLILATTLLMMRRKLLRLTIRDRRRFMHR